MYRILHPLDGIQSHLSHGCAGMRHGPIPEMMLQAPLNYKNPSKTEKCTKVRHIISGTNTCLTILAMRQASTNF